MIHTPERPSEGQTLGYATTLREVRLGTRRLARDPHYQELKQQLNSAATPDAERVTIATEMRRIHDVAMTTPRSPRAPRHKIAK